MTGTRIVTHGDAPADWDSLAASAGSFYHHAAWIRGLRDCFGFRVHFLAAERAGAIVAGLPIAEVPALFGPRRLVSLPFSYAAGPFGAPEQHDALAGGALELAQARRIERVEIKRDRVGDGPAEGFSRETHYSTFRIEGGQTEDDVWRTLHPGSTQRSIRKGAKLGVTSTIGREAADWLAMAELQEATSHRLGLPAPPRRFFVQMCRDLQARGLADLYLARGPEGRLAAGIVLWKGPRYWIYAFGASRPEALELRPNHVLIWAAIRDALGAGRGFDLGRAAPEQEGLTEFKRRWGADEQPLAYDYWPVASGLNVAPRDRGSLALASRIWRRLPAPVARAGSRLYRYLG